MAKTALILGGTKGLGLSLAGEAGAVRKNIWPVVLGRSSPYNLPFKTRSIKIDLTNQASITNFFQENIYSSFDYIFWNAGIFLRKPLSSYSGEELDKMISTHLLGPIQFLRLWHLLQLKSKAPYHLITIASTSSWRIRENETLYCALKAAKAAFTRNFARELVRDLPGSKITLVNPGGIKTPNFWQNSGQDISKFMDPDAVAKIIWSEVEGQRDSFKEVQIMRNDDGNPNVSYGPRISELPFGEEEKL